MHHRVATALLAALFTTLLTASLAAGAAKPAPFQLTSVDPGLRRGVPSQYVLNGFGCSGGNQSPALQWTNPPPGTQSFVLTLFDRDERSTPSGWWHWVVYDIPANTTHLEMNAGVENSTLLPKGTLQGRTDLGNLAYHGPCPAKGDPPHRYTFTLYALKVAKLSVDPGASGAMVTSTAQEHVLGKAVFVAHYAR